MSRDGLSPLRKFIPELPDHLPPCFAVDVGFHALGRRAVHHADDAVAGLRPRDQDLERVGRGAENPGHLLAIFYRVQEVDGEGVLHNEIE